MPPCIEQGIVRQPVITDDSPVQNPVQQAPMISANTNDRIKEIYTAL
ncbi:MAG: hypothetical protein ACOYBJ_00010 [Patescibacteria group bacterium]